MSNYQPGIPTGLVNLDVDYQNIQGNFQQLDTSFGVDHISFSQSTNNGYHTDIHFVPFSTIASNPPTNYPISQSATPPSQPPQTPGFGQLFTAQSNDGINDDEILYYLSGGNRLTQLTRNFTPNNTVNNTSPPTLTGASFLPGGFILNWGRVTISANPTTVSFAQPYSTRTVNPMIPNIFSIQVTPLQNTSYYVSNITSTGFNINGLSAPGNQAYWMALGQ